MDNEKTSKELEILHLMHLLRALDYANDNLLRLESLQLRNQLHIVRKTIKQTIKDLKK